MSIRRVVWLICQCTLFSVAALFLSSCASSRIIESWHDPAVVRGGMQSIIVVAMVKDDMRRRVWEDLFVKNLSPKGIKVVPAYTVFPKKAPQEAQLREYVKNNAGSAVLMISKTGERRESYVIPGEVRVQRDYYPTIGGSFWGYYGRSYVVEHTPDRVETELIVSYEASVWDAVGDGRLVWKAKSESTLEPSSRQAMTIELAELFVSRLQVDGIF